MRGQQWLIGALVLAGVLAGGNAHAESEACPDAGVWSGKLLTDICWGCLFPIRVAGINLTGGDVPSDAATQSVCACGDNNGVQHPGIVTSMYEPARIVELVRKPGCSMALGGVTLNINNSTTWGTGSAATVTNSETGFYNYHYYAFPLLSIMELYLPKSCSVDGYGDFDMMYMSELDPTWNNDELAFFTNPEAAMAANPVAISACATEAAKMTVGQPIDSMWWCAGSWGGIYPFSGYTGNLDFARGTSLLSARAIAAQHRRGLAHLSMGNDALCRGKIFPTIPKQQYKFGMYFPVSEPNKGHMLGKNPWQWDNGPGSRKIPAVGEDALYILYRWRDCCSTY